MIFLSTFFIQSGKLVGEYFESQLRMTVDNVITQVDRLVTGIPRAAVTVLLVILAGWLWSAGANLLRSIGFRIERANSTVSIRSGIFTKRHYFIDTDKIFCADLRQNILMKLFSVSSVQVDCAGYGQGKNEIPVFIPITTKQNILSSIKLLLPKLNITPPEVKPRPIVFFRYICTPLYIMLGIVPAAWIMIKFFPLWDSFIIFVAVMLEIPSLIFLAAKVVSFFTTGISVSGDTVSIKYGWGLRFHTVIVRRDNIAKISITQSVFQKLSKSCNVTFYTKNKLMKFHFVLSLPCEETTKYLKQTGLCEQNLIF